MGKKQAQHAIELAKKRLVKNFCCNVVPKLSFYERDPITYHDETKKELYGFLVKYTNDLDDFLHKVGTIASDETIYGPEATEVYEKFRKEFNHDPWIMNVCELSNLLNVNGFTWTEAVITDLLLLFIDIMCKAINDVYPGEPIDPEALKKFNQGYILGKLTFNFTDTPKRAHLHSSIMSNNWNGTP